MAKINCFSSRPTLAFSYELNYGSPHEMQQKNVFYKWFHIIIILCCADCTNIKTICDVRVVIKDWMWSKIIQNCVKQTTLTHKYCNLNLRIKLSPLRIERMQQKISGFYTYCTVYTVHYLAYNPGIFRCILSICDRRGFFFQR